MTKPDKVDEEKIAVTIEDDLTAFFSFDMRHLTKSHFDILCAATDVMRKIPFFQQLRKDGNPYKYSGGLKHWISWGSSDTIISACNSNWALTITAVDGGRFNVHAFKAKAVSRCALRSFKVVERRTT